MFLSELKLLDLPQPDFWAVAAPLVWQDGVERFVVPVGFKTDLASIPVALRSFLDRNGDSRRPAALHDWLYHSHAVTRTRADDVLRRALLADGETILGARIYWAGVRIGGASAYAAHPDGLTAADFTSQAAYNVAVANNPDLIAHT